LTGLWEKAREIDSTSVEKVSAPLIRRGRIEGEVQSTRSAAKSVWREQGNPDLRTLEANSRIGWSASFHGGCNQISRHALVLWEFQDGVGDANSKHSSGKVEEHFLLIEPPIR
jgi:hypothetical protein